MTATSPAQRSLQLGRSIAFVGGGIGDVVMHTGHFQAIARASSNGKVTIGCRSAAPIIDLFQGNDFVDGVIGFGDGADKNRVVVSKATAKLREGRFDSFFALKSNPRLAAAAFLAGIPNRYGFMQALDPRALLLTHRTVAPKVHTHPVHMAKADLMLNELGLPFDHATTRLMPRTDLQPEAKRILGDGPAIALGVNVSDPKRQWGHRFIPLVQHLASRVDARFVLFGAADVAQVAQDIIDKSGVPTERFINLTTMGCPLSVSHAVLAKCKFYVGNDSSGTNLAVMSGLPAIIFCALDLVLCYSPLIIPISPLPAGSGVDGIGLDRVLGVTMETIHTHCPQLLKSTS